MTQIAKFHPANRFAPDITGESGCANCGGDIEFVKATSSLGEILQYYAHKKETPDYNITCFAKPKKSQTIRPKPIEVGEKVALWEMWRGMKKGLYCVKCFAYWGRLGDTAREAACGCFDTYEEFPRKLLNAEITECVPIEMLWDAEDNVLDIRKEGKYLESIEPDSALGQSAFVAKDTPSWSNKQFCDFFLKTYPDIRKDWMKFWIWKWRAVA
ncbi:MAG: hypothetical protein PHU04_05690 [Candidatus Peribacteraceae bacterium]|nr:hypothetical protein [Candidatus Peribacteraceae bacterium]